MLGCSELFHAEFNYRFFFIANVALKNQILNANRMTKTEKLFVQTEKGICIYFGEIFGFDIMVF